MPRERSISDERGDLATVEAVYGSIAEPLTRFASSLVGPGDAHDLVAAAVTKCLKARNWDSLQNPSHYLYRAVFNESQTISRRAAVRTRALRRLNAESRDTADNTGRLAENATITRLTVGNALRKLSPRQRAVLVLSYWQDLPAGEIADVLGISEGSVKKHLARARAALRKELA